jgi:gluconolactonase
LEPYALGMNSIFVGLCAFGMMGCMITHGAEQSLIAEGAKVEVLGEGYSFTEGPAADREGNVYFTDQPNDRIVKVERG